MVKGLATNQRPMLLKKNVFKTDADSVSESLEKFSHGIPIVFQKN